MLESDDPELMVKARGNALTHDENRHGSGYSRGSLVRAQKSSISVAMLPLPLWMAPAACSCS